jgi:hypothetical protein
MQSMRSAVVLKDELLKRNLLGQQYRPRIETRTPRKKGQSSTNDTAKGKVKVVTVHAIKAYRERRYSSTHS